jgi:2-methylisocitrate lyase-like PEP mutase family enzyme
VIERPVYHPEPDFYDEALLPSGAPRPAYAELFRRLADAGIETVAERVAAAAEAAHSGPRPFVLTARAENLLHGRRDLDDTIARLQAYQEAGADVLFAPGLGDIADIRRVVESLDRPVNVLARPGAPSIAELADAGVARVSVGGAFAFAALGGALTAARELLDEGTYGYWEQASAGAKAARAAFGQ